MKLKLVTYISIFLLFSSPVTCKQHKIGVIGTGYVGLVLGACLSHFEHNVICADIDAAKIARLQKGEMPIYEPGLQEIVEDGRKKGHITFSADPDETVRSCDVIFIAVDTPMSDDGKANLSAIEAVARMIGKNLNGYKVIATKSTVPIGTGKKIQKIIKKYAPVESDFDIVSNPEFLREGSAVKDFLFPDRVVVGAHSERALATMQEIYEPLRKDGVTFLATDIAAAETIKYAANAFLAVKISFINEISALCDATGADVSVVSRGMGLDNRIGSKFLSPGPGFGGSCFPKDVAALLHKGRSQMLDLKVVKAALEANDEQKRRMCKKLAMLLNNDLDKKTVALLGVAFKANTDDVRQSPAITLVEFLQEHEVTIKAYDPVAADNMKKIAPSITFCSSPYEAADEADAVVIVTEWDEFKSLDLQKIKELMKQPVILDTRNILKTKKLRNLGFSFANIGNAVVEGE